MRQDIRVDNPTIALFAICINLLHGGVLAVLGIRDLIREREEYDQKFNGLTALIKGIALILISVFLYYLLTRGLKPEYIIFVMIVAPLLSYSKVIWESKNRIFRAVFESRADVMVQINNDRWQQLEDQKTEYVSIMTDKSPAYVESKKS
jgi:hypothetical protein